MPETEEKFQIFLFFQLNPLQLYRNGVYLTGKKVGFATFFGGFSGKKSSKKAKLGRKSHFNTFYYYKFGKSNSQAFF